MYANQTTHTKWLIPILFVHVKPFSTNLRLRYMIYRSFNNRKAAYFHVHTTAGKFV
jgi:hypothetical protein